MHNFNLTDETFDLNQSYNYHLLMQSSLKGFSYAIIDSLRNKCILLRNFETKCTDWHEFKNYLLTITEADSNLKVDYKKIIHIISEKDFTLVPEDYLPQEEKDLQRWFPGVSGTGPRVIGSLSRASNSRILCPYAPAFVETLQKNFKGVNLSHISLPFIHNLINESSRTLRHVFQFLIHDEFIIAGVAHSAKLDFINSFKVESFEDILYFIASTLEKFKISPVLAEIAIQNDSSYADLNTRLETYIGKVRNLKATHNMVYSYIFTEDVLVQFANMLNLYHCE